MIFSAIFFFVIVILGGFASNFLLKKLYPEFKDNQILGELVVRFQKFRLEGFKSVLMLALLIFHLFFLGISTIRKEINLTQIQVFMLFGIVLHLLFFLFLAKGIQKIVLILLPMYLAIGLGLIVLANRFETSPPTITLSYIFVLNGLFLILLFKISIFIKSERPLKK